MFNGSNRQRKKLTASSAIFFSLSTEEWENQGWPWVRKVYSKEKLKIRMMLRKYLWSWEEKWWLSCWTGINDHSTTDCKSLSTFHQLGNSTICGKAKGAGLVWKGHSFQGVTQVKWTQCALTMMSEHPTFPSHPKLWTSELAPINSERLYITDEVM